MMAFAITPAQAKDGSERLTRIEADNTLRVCIWPNYYSISYLDRRTGTLEGIDVDLARMLARDLGVEVRFVESSFAKLIENMTSDACDISMHGVGVRPDRAEVMDFANAHLRSGIHAVAPLDHPTINSWTDIDKPGHVVVVQRATYMEPVMRESLSAAELMVVDDFKAREQEVRSGRADVFMTDYPYGRRQVELTGWAKMLSPPETLAPTDYAFAVPKDEPVWLERVNSFVAKVKADGTLRSLGETYNLTPIVLTE
ncbi:MAG: substrate-binding periplasmic protein [Rhodospirillaceae bacterium]